MKQYKHDVSLDRPYIQSVDVKCPSCKGKAVANRNGFSCSECVLEIKEKWYGPECGIAACSCHSCGRSLFRKFSRHKNQLTYRFKCPVCSTVTKTGISWFRRHIDGKDPYFGLDYFLKVNFEGNTFWIHNKDHLDALKMYIDTELTDGLSDKMLKSLPHCVRNHKNKAALLKIISDLEN